MPFSSVRIPPGGVGGDVPSVSHCKAVLGISYSVARRFELGLGSRSVLRLGAANRSRSARHHTTTGCPQPHRVRPRRRPAATGTTDGRFTRRCGFDIIGGLRGVLRAVLGGTHIRRRRRDVVPAPGDSQRASSPPTRDPAALSGRAPAGGPLGVQQRGRGRHPAVRVHPRRPPRTGVSGAVSCAPWPTGRAAGRTLLRHCERGGA